MNTILDAQVTTKLNELHALASAQGQQDREALTNAQRFMAVSPEQGQFLNFLAGLNKSQNMVEFGCSFGISAIYLAAAAKDNGGHVMDACWLLTVGSNSFFFNRSDQFFR